MRTVIWQTLKWKQSRKTYWLKSTDFKQLNSAKGSFMSQASDRQLTSEEEYRNIFEAASDGLVIYDMELDSVVEANPAACEMHGYTRQEFIGLNLAVFMLPESHALFREQVRLAEPESVFASL